MTERQQKIIEYYAHDYREMPMSKGDLKEMLSGIVESLECNHQCTSNCRREGCECACGPSHF